MPIYDYRCNKCSQVQSIFVRDLKKKLNPKCEKCNSKDIKHLSKKEELKQEFKEKEKEHLTTIEDLKSEIKELKDQMKENSKKYQEEILSLKSLSPKVGKSQLSL